MRNHGRNNSSGSLESLGHVEDVVVKHLSVVEAEMMQWARELRQCSWHSRGLLNVQLDREREFPCKWPS